MKPQVGRWLKNSYFSNVSFRLIGTAFPAALFIFTAITPDSVPAAKPRAVISAQWGENIPSIEEQVLFYHLLTVLRKTHDLQDQSRFEQALKENRAEGGFECRQRVQCVLRVHRSFPWTLLYQLKREQEGNRERLGLIFSTHSGLWQESYFTCTNCESRLNEYLVEMSSYFNAVVFGIKSDIIPLAGVAGRKQPTAAPAGAKSASGIKKQDVMTRIEIHHVPDKPVKPVLPARDTEAAMKRKPPPPVTTDPGLGKPEGTSPERDEKFTLELLRFRLAERQYNQLIWKGIKNRLMFFRHQNRGENLRDLEAKLRLNIDSTGKVIRKQLLSPSDSKLFNQSILDSVSKLDLPPPMKILVDHPPYVVTILIKP